jgi:hypothetical protein
MPKSGHPRLGFRVTPRRLAFNLHSCGREDTSNPVTRTAAMFDTALLIASALSVALMVAFFDLP